MASSTTTAVFRVVLLAFVVPVVRADTEASWQLDCDDHLVVNPPSDKHIKFGDAGKLSFNPTTGDISSAQMDTILTEVAALKVENNSLKEQASRIDKILVDVDALKEENKGLKDQVQEAADARNASQSSFISLSQVHPGGDLDFTEGSASLAILKQTLPGVKVFLSSLNIKGSNVKGSVVSELLKDVTTLISLQCSSSEAHFATGDDELVFASLASVASIYIRDNGADGPSSVSFPALKVVPGNVQLTANKRLKSISMPALVGVGSNAHFYNNAVLESVQLPNLLSVGGAFHLHGNDKLATDGIKVSSQFESVGSSFNAMSSGFTCTAGNGLAAVVAGAESTSGGNPASCQKQ